MTQPEQQAQELIEKFTKVIWDSGNSVSKPMIVSVCIIYCNGILEVLATANEYYEQGEQIEYWQSVLQILKSK